MRKPSAHDRLTNLEGRIYVPPQAEPSPPSVFYDELISMGYQAPVPLPGERSADYLDRVADTEAGSDMIMDLYAAVHKAFYS